MPAQQPDKLAANELLLLKAQTFEESLNFSDCLDDVLGKDKPKWRRRHLSKFEAEFLENEFLKDPIWKVPRKKWLSAKLEMSRAKIYKWHYDRRRRAAEEQASNTS